ncbi:MAG: hypothetical protein P8P30_00765 [Rickettsiales bacterium]|nr:hypothetical protein [Rickettsiales bacterium]
MQLTSRTEMGSSFEGQATGDLSFLDGDMNTALKSADTRNLDELLPQIKALESIVSNLHSLIGRRLKQEQQEVNAEILQAEEVFTMGAEDTIDVHALLNEMENLEDSYR